VIFAICENLPVIGARSFIVEYRASAVKQLAGLPKEKRRKVVSAMEVIARDPFSKRNTMTPLTGTKDHLRLRVGDWRVVFVVDRRRGVLDVYQIAHRREVYR
jgi:mRNA interferase RelE/StbE